MAEQTNADVVGDVVAEAVAGASKGAALSPAGAVAGAGLGAAKAMAKSSKGRQWLIGIILLGFLASPVGAVIVGLSLVGLMAGQAATEQTGSYNVASDDGATNTDMTTFGQASAATGIPWQVLYALWYYSTGPGKGWGIWPGTCAQAAAVLDGATSLDCPSMPSSPGQVAPAPPSTAAPTTVPKTGTTHTKPHGPTTTTTSTTTVPPIIYQGPFDLAPGVLDAPSAEGLTTSSAFVAQHLASSLAAMPSWDSDFNLATGVIVAQGYSSPYLSDSPSAGGLTVRADLTAAIAELPNQANAGTFKATWDANVFELAQATYLDWAPTSDVATTGLGMTCGALGPGGTLTVSTTSGSAVELQSAQVDNAAVIAHVGASLGIPQAGQVVALDVALTESDLWDLPNSTVPGSESFPGVQWGPYSASDPPDNGTSVGLFQQQDNWGTLAARMTASSAATEFYQGVAGGPGGLTSVPDWAGLEPWVAAQDVQASAFPQAYQPWAPAAESLLGALAGVTCTPAGGAPPQPGKPLSFGPTVLAAAKSYIGKVPYVWGGGTAQGPSGSAVAPPAAVGQAGFDCSGLTLYAYAAAGIVLPHYSGAGGQWSMVQASGDFTMDMSALVPGDLVFFNGSDGTATNPGHVGIYLGNYEMVDAYATGTYVRIDQIGPGTEFYATFDGGGSVG